MQLLDYEQKHIGTLRPLLSECTVLLKSNGAFPIDKPEKVALYGSGARKTIKGGTGSGEVNSRYFITIEDALKNEGFNITTSGWLDSYDTAYADAKKDFYKEIKKRAKEAHTNAVVVGMGAVMLEPEYDIPLNGDGDLCIYVVSRISGEGNDREPKAGDILLTESEKRDILACNKKYSKFLLVLNVGGPVDLSEVDEVENILLLSQLGIETGYALTDIILGHTNPSGKLATTWTKWSDYPSEIGDFGDINNTHYTDGIYVGYRYFDSIGKRAMFPFGYGKSFTTFSISKPTVNATQSTITVKTTVSNTGKRAGKEVVQLYVSVPAKKLDQPYQTLAAFAKTKSLSVGESEELTLTFDLESISSYDSDMAAYILESGNYVLRIGNSSVDTIVAGTISVSNTLIVRQVKNLLNGKDLVDFKPENPVNNVADATEATITITKDDIVTSVIDYNASYEIAPEVDALSVEDLSLLANGAFNPNGGIASIIGESSQTVAGAAGETATVAALDVKPLVMADGPAGVRLQREYYEDERGAHGLGAPLPESMAEFLNGPSKLLLKLLAPKAKKGYEVKNQYCTAIPIGTAIAQSFNVDLAKLCGDIVGDEMQRFNVQLWLAPALNIHRSIRCGRNFEYFSEDPLISGKMAAALTLGVQAHKGCATTIKHFCANNQETNRYYNQSIVSERAMREIYLRGFEICVKESQPKALMTSYNLLNGIHTSESRELTEDILRREWGYKGIVMTDWVVAMMEPLAGSVHARPDAYKVAAAGGDLFMPGSKLDYENILYAVKSGDLSLEQLKINATRVYNLTKELHN